MKLKKLSMIALVSALSFTLAAHANEVVLTTNQPIKVDFRIAHKNPNHQPVFGELRSIEVNEHASVSMSLDNYDRVGMVIVAVNGHELPSSVNSFEQPKQCSMTTDKIKSTGALEFTLSPHSINCRTYGGIFG